MARRVQWRRGTSAQHGAFTGALAEITVDTDTGAPRVHNGTTPGGSLIGEGINVRWFATIAAADTAALARSTHLRFVPGDHEVAANLTIASPVHMEPGALLVPASGATVTIDGPFSAGLAQAFDLSAGGSVVFGPGSVTELVPQWWGAKCDGVADDSVAVGHAIAEASRIRLDPSETHAAVACMVRFPAGECLVTQNNFIGANLSSAAYGGRSDNLFVGSGRNSSIIVFRPSSASGGVSACYDQSLTPASLLNGFRVESLGFRFDDADNGGAPIHFIKSEAAPDEASQNWRLDDVRIKGVDGSILFYLGGTAQNEDTILCRDLVLEGFYNVVKSPTNTEALLHFFWGLTCYDHKGDMFDYYMGGCLKVWGCDAIMEGTDAVDTAVLKVTGGTNGQTYSIDNLRAELRGEFTHLLLVPAAAENTIVFTDCSVTNVTNNQAWAKVVIQHHATIIFERCLLPERSSTLNFQFIDSTSGTDYQTTQGAHSYVKFINCDNTGGRLNDVDGWADYSALTGPNANYRTSQVVYQGCGNLPDSVEYGHVYRLGRTFVPNVPPRLIFSGTEFPYGDGAAAVAGAGDLHCVVPLNNFVTEIIVMRKALSGATNYQIEFIDTLERTNPTTGVVFGEMTVAANNTAIVQRVSILRQFTGTRAQRTIWTRAKAGVTLTVGQTGVPTDGGIWAEVL